MCRGGKINEQMPHKMVMLERLLGIEYRPDGVEHSAQSNERDKLPRCVAHEEREEEDHGPPHHQIYRQADGGNRAAAERLVEDAEDDHRPLQDEYQPPLPTAYHRERYGGVAARDGDVDEDVVEDVEYLLVARVVQHRVVQSRDEEHQEQTHAKHTHAKAHQRRAALHEAIYGCKGNGQQHQDAHHAVRDGVADLLAECGDINFCHRFSTFMIKQI